MVRTVALVCCVVGLTAMVVEASADRRVGTDSRASIGFQLDGASLRVDIRPGALAKEVRRQVYGQAVEAFCVADFELGPRRRVSQRLTWPEGSDVVNFGFERDLSGDATGCFIELEGGLDLADVGFGPPPARLVVQVEQVNGSPPADIRSFLRLRDRNGRSVTFPGRRPLSRLLKPGPYRLAHYERRCLGSCRDLGPPVGRCARRLRLPGGVTRAVLVVVDRARHICDVQIRAPIDAERKAKRTIRLAVRSAVVDGDFARACRFGTRAGRRRLIEGFNSSSGPDFPDCVAIVRSEVRGYPYVAGRLRDGVVISGLRVRGRRAHARVADGLGRYPGSGHVSLRRVRGRWRIDDSDLIPHGD